MSFADLLYPDNPGKRRKVTQLAQKILDLMGANFDATNELIDLLNKHAKTSMRKVYVNENDTLKNNANALTRKITEVQSEVEKIDKRLKENLDPKAYAAIHDVDLSIEQTFQLVKNISTIVSSTLITVVATVAIVAIAKGFILVSVVAKIGTLATCAVAGLLISALVVGVDLIVSIFTGAAERDQLDDAIRELQGTINEFEPASKAYTRNITRVIVKVEALLED